MSNGAGRSGRPHRGRASRDAYRPTSLAGQEAASEDKDGIGTVPRQVLASIMGDFASLELITKARQDLWQRVGLLFDEELLRYGEVLDEAGPIDPVAAVRLYQAEYALEAAR